MKIGLKRADYLFIGALFLLGAVLLSGALLWPRHAGEQVRITLDGETYGIYSLRKEQEIAVMRDGRTVNVVEISDGGVSMRRAQCPDHLCIRQGRISAGGETLICLPNKVVVEVVSENEKTYDSVSQ